MAGLSSAAAAAAATDGAGGSVGRAASMSTLDSLAGAGTVSTRATVAGPSFPPPALASQHLLSRTCLPTAGSLGLKRPLSAVDLKQPPNGGAGPRGANGAGQGTGPGRQRTWTSPTACAHALLVRPECGTCGGHVRSRRGRSPWAGGTGRCRHDAARDDRAEPATAHQADQDHVGRRRCAECACSNPRRNVPALFERSCGGWGCGFYQRTTMTMTKSTSMIGTPDAHQAPPPLAKRANEPRVFGMLSPAAAPRTV